MRRFAGAVLVAALFLTVLQVLEQAPIVKAPTDTSHIAPASAPEPQPETIWLTAAPRLAAFLWVIFLGVLLGYFLVKGDDLMPPTLAWFKWFVAMNFVTMLAIVISTLAVVAGIDACSRNIRVITKLKFSFVALACAFLSWFAIHWHIIGPTHRI